MSNKLSSSEKYLWHYIDNHMDIIPNISIVKLSELSSVSTSTIVRAMKKKGYTGYTDFKQTILKENNSIKKFPNFKNMSQEIQDVALKNQYEVTNTIQKINMSDIEDAVQKIYSSKKVYIFARGFSEMVAREMQVKFQLLYKNFEFHNDPNIITTITNRINKNDTIIYISLNGNTKELVESAQIAHQKNIFTIVITTNDNGDILKYSDLAIVGFKQDKSYFPAFEVHSRLPLEVIGRILLDSYAIKIR